MAVVLHDVSKIYRAEGEEVHALREVSLEVPNGEQVAIMGPSTSGKSTLMHIIACLDRPTSGQYELDGVEVSHLSDRELTGIRNHTIGLAFRSYHLLPHMSLLDEVELPLVYSGVKNRHALAQEALQSVGLGGYTRRRLAELSAEQAPRVALARALITHPSVLIFPDEADFELDEQMLHEVWPDIQALRQRRIMTIFITPHTTEEAEQCDRVVLLIGGRVAAFDTPAALKAGVGNDCIELRSEAGDAVLAALREQFGIRARLVEGLVRFHVSDARAFLPRLLDGLGIRPEQVTIRSTSLEDVCHAYVERVQASQPVTSTAGA
jgi:putative ABC transport system ATP-binding protein